MLSHWVQVDRGIVVCDCEVEAAELARCQPTPVYLTDGEGGIIKFYDEV